MGERGMNSNARAKSERTKLAVAGGLAVIMLAVGVRMFSSGPESAVAATEPGGAAAPVAAPASTARPVHVPRVIDWPGKVARDPFASSLVYRPVVVPKPVEPTPPPAPPPPPPVDVAKEASEAIPLTATVLGDKPIAMINGRIYPVGGAVAGFRIVEIHARRIVVERDGQRASIDVKP